MEDVEVADDALQAGRHARPRLAPGVGDGQRPHVPLDRHAVQRGLDVARAALARRREGDDVLGARLEQAAQHPADVVADPRARMRERRDVDDDPQGR